MVLRRFLTLALGAVLLTASPEAMSAPHVPAPQVKAPTLPTHKRYVEAMQNAHHYLRDGALHGRVELVKGHDGSPLRWSGNFGTVFKGRTPTQTLAIRVFHKGDKSDGIAEIQHRYEHLQAFFTKLSVDKKMPAELLPVAFVRSGLHIDGHDMPIVKSPWIEGDELHDFVGKQIAGRRAASLEKLAQNWRGVVRDLRSVGIAHGDLQHRNVKVEDGGSMRLIDYDSMFVPPLKGQFNSEIGHPNFEHPAYHFDAQGNRRRKARPFDGKMDHFSSLVIYTSLVALSKHPQLWKDYHNDDNLIFDGRRDLLHPDSSPVFKVLSSSPHAEVRTLARKLMEYAKGAPTAVPPLEEALGAPEPHVAFRERVSLHGERVVALGVSLGSQAVAHPRVPEPLAHTGGTQHVASTGTTRGTASVKVQRGGTAHANDPLSPFKPSVVPRIDGPLRAVSTKTPGTLLVLLDGSGSMENAFGGVTKAEAAANAVNGVLAEFVHASNQGGVIRDRWHVGVHKYSEESTVDVLHHNLPGNRIRGVHPISAVAHNPREVVEVPDNEGYLVPSPLWVEPAADGRTPMVKAFRTADRALAGNGKQLVLAVHVTDGEPTDGDPLPAVKQLASNIARQGGQLLMTNIHLSDNAEHETALVFPTPDEVAHLDANAKRLYAMSSEVPAELAARLGTKPGARMFAYNTAPAQLASVLRAGSSVAGGVR